MAAEKPHPTTSHLVSYLSTTKENRSMPLIVKAACARNSTGKADIENLSTKIAITVVQPIINPTLNNALISQAYAVRENSGG